MTARKLAQPFPIATPDTDAMDAAQTLAAQRLPGLIVCDDEWSDIFRHNTRTRTAP